MAMEGDIETGEVPPVTEDIGLPTPPSPGRLPPPHLPPPDPDQGWSGQEGDEPAPTVGGRA